MTSRRIIDQIFHSFSFFLLTVLLIVVSTVRYWHMFSMAKFLLDKVVVMFVRTLNEWFEFFLPNFDIEVLKDHFHIDVQSWQTMKQANWWTAVGKNNRTSSINTSNNASACCMCERTWWVDCSNESMISYWQTKRENERKEKRGEERNSSLSLSLSLRTLLCLSVGGIPSCSNMIWSFFVFLWSSFSSGSDILFCSVPMVRQQHHHRHHRHRRDSYSWKSLMRMDWSSSVDWAVPKVIPIAN